MKYLSIFSGVDAASLAFMPLGWECIGFSEIDEFPSAVLAHRFPDVVNLGDICQVNWSEFVSERGRPDVIVGGSPCTSFSIAGRRESLDGESRLMFEYIRAVEEIRPRYFIWENTPGVLSTRDNAFGQLLHAMAELGYCDLAYRILDAQFVRVPVRDGDGRIAGWVGPVAQRRRRVFLVAVPREYAGRAAAILSLTDCGVRNPTPSSRKREELAAEATGGAGASGQDVTAFKWFAGAKARTMLAYDDGTTPTLTNSDAHQPAIAFAQPEPIVMASGQSNAEISQGGVAPTIAARNYKDPPILFEQQQATD